MLQHQGQRVSRLPHRCRDFEIWIADLIKEKTSRTWPDHIFDLAGAWKDLPTAEEIRAGMGKDAKREPL
jgi:hypothetical protein